MKDLNVFNYETHKDVLNNLLQYMKINNLAEINLCGYAKRKHITYHKLITAIKNDKHKQFIHTSRGFVGITSEYKAKPPIIIDNILLVPCERCKKKIMPNLKHEKQLCRRCHEYVRRK